MDKEERAIAKTQTREAKTEKMGTATAHPHLYAALLLLLNVASSRGSVGFSFYNLGAFFIKGNFLFLLGPQATASLA